MVVKLLKDPKILLSIGSIFISFLVLYLKYLAWHVTNSVAFYSDMLETLINVAAALFTTMSLYVASLPADYDHTYGHYKAEYLSAAAEGLLVLFTAILIVHEAWQGLQHPKILNSPFLGIFINGSAGIVNLVWSLTLIKLGKKLRSPALIAGGEHVLSDVWTTVGLISGFVLIPIFQWQPLDSLLGLLIAVNIIRIGFKIMKQSVNGLMDRVPSLTLKETIKNIVHTHAPEAIDCHMIRIRQAGSMTFIDFNLIVPGTLTVSQAHQICDRIEYALAKAIGSVSINIHVEPETHI
ncbi:cation diffusion facilitator family transporter [Commensalibacter sp. Nvir]|uniref:cation diffusion facilitator family transporter n=1 Tax=Commensalibacter sp. Nvir TaxID=3069817 RepID=UPI0030C7B2A8